MDDDGDIDMFTSEPRLARNDGTGTLEDATPGRTPTGAAAGSSTTTPESAASGRPDPDRRDGAPKALVVAANAPLDNPRFTGQPDTGDAASLWPAGVHVTITACRS